MTPARKGTRGKKAILEAGRGIIRTAFDSTTGIWTIYYTDNTTETHDLSELFGGSGSDESADSMFEYELLSDNTFAIKRCLIDEPTEISIPSTFSGKPVTKILKDVFKNKTSLTSVILAGNIKSVGESAFDGCTALSTVTINSDSDLQEIGSYAFQNCTSLNSIYIPKHVNYIGEYAFYQAGLQTATFDVTDAWNLYGQYNGYQAHLCPTNTENAAKALIGPYTSNSASDFYKQVWRCGAEYKITYGYEREL